MRSIAKDRIISFIVVLSVFSALLSIGCGGNISRMRKVPVTIGEQFAFDISLDRAKVACRNAMLLTGFTIAEERDIDTKTWAITGELSMSMETLGEFARVVVMQVNSEVVSFRYAAVTKVDGNAEDLEGVRRNFLVNLGRAIAEAGGS
jgi:hypothetical protein